MRLLHTSDWHLGRLMAQESLLGDQAALLDQIFDTLVVTQSDVLIIAGDIFDRANPRSDAVQLLDRFLTRVYAETKAAIVAIAGNHDAPERIAFGGALQDPARVLIRGPLSRSAKPLILQDEHGLVAISALPYSETYAARAHFAASDLATPEHVLTRQISEARTHVPTGARWVLVAHGFVQGGSVSESERSLDFVGGVETVPHTLFEGAAYVALGHLHRQQIAGADHIRYSGSPMAFGFDEVGGKKGMLLVDLGPTGSMRAESLAFAPIRSVRVIEGLLEDLVRAGAGQDCRDFVKAVLTDEGELVDPMGRLRSVYPFALQIERAARRTQERLAGVSAAIGRRSPVEVVAAFVADMRGEGLNAAEEGAVRTYLAVSMMDQA